MAGVAGASPNTPKAQHAEVVLDTRFEAGVRFLAQWQAWRSLAGRSLAGADNTSPRRGPRHYIGLVTLEEARALPAALRELTTAPAALSTSLQAGECTHFAALVMQLLEVLAQTPTLGVGFSRLQLDAGAVALTLCTGDPPTQLAELDLLADQIWTTSTSTSTSTSSAPNTTPATDNEQLTGPQGSNAWEWDKWQFKRLAKVCQLNARVALPCNLRGQPTILSALHGAGFVPCETHFDSDSASASDSTWWVQFSPSWTLRDPRYQPRLGPRSWWQQQTQTQQSAPHPPGDQSPHDALYAPPCTEQNAPNAALRSTQIATAERPRCAVIGAGLSGASVAFALAQRGWWVDVYDQAPEPAGGASGLPVGLMVPHVSRDDAPRSRLSRAGVRLTLAHAHTLLETGRDWLPSGALQHPLAAPGNGLDAGTEFAHSVWHAEGSWVKPAALVRAWLRHPQIEFHPLSAVDRLEDKAHPQGRWCLRDIDGESLGRADCVVVANARGCHALLRPFLQAYSQPTTRPTTQLSQPSQCTESSPLSALQAIHGGVSSGPCPAAAENQWPRFAVHGNGHFVAGIPACMDDTYGPVDAETEAQASKTRWYIGATFETDGRRATDATLIHANNLARLETLLPELAATVATQMQSGRVEAWIGTRCVSHDRLPLVGPIHPGPAPTLWVSTAMGARGLSFAALCAEILVAKMHGEPLPVEASLARQLSSLRPLRSALHNAQAGALPQSGTAHAHAIDANQAD